MGLTITLLEYQLKREHGSEVPDFELIAGPRFPFGELVPEAQGG
jgi:hypothetical protein